MKLIPFLFIVFYSVFTFGQVEETFESDLTANSTSFTSGGVEFVLGQDLIVTNRNGDGYSSSNWFLEHAICPGVKAKGSLSTADGSEFYLNGLSVSGSKNCGNAANGRVRVFWYRAGRLISKKRYDISKTTNNGYTDLDFTIDGKSSISTDSIVVKILGRLQSVKLDNFDWSKSLEHKIKRNLNVLSSKEFVNENVTYQWYNCTSTCTAIPSETNKNFIASQIGQYAVEVSDGTITYMTANKQVKIIPVISDAIVETFEIDQEYNGHTFTSSGKEFELGNNWEVDSIEFWGVESTDWYIDNSNNCNASSSTFIGSISTENGSNIFFNSAWMFASKNCDGVADGSIRITWYKNGKYKDSEEYEVNSASSEMRSNGFVFLDFSLDQRSQIFCDSIIFETLGDLTYLAIDDFSWSKRLAAPEAKIGDKTTDFQEMSSSEVYTYPNPAVDIVTIQHSGFESGDVFISNAMGEVMYSTEINGTETIMDISELSEGMYFLRLESEGKSDISRIIKK